MLEFRLANCRRFRYRHSLTIAAADQIMRKTHSPFATAIAPVFPRLGVDSCFDSAHSSTVRIPRVWESS